MRTNTQPQDYHRPVFAVGDYLALINAKRDQRRSLENKLRRLNPQLFHQIAATEYRLDQDEYIAALESEIKKISGP